MFPSSIRALCLLWVNCLSKAKSRSYLCEREGMTESFSRLSRRRRLMSQKWKQCLPGRDEGSKLGRLHTAVDSTASPVWKRRILCVVSLLKQTLDSPVQMHAVLFILLLYYFGAGRRSGWGGAGGERAGGRPAEAFHLFLFWMFILFYGLYTWLSDDASVPPAVPNICSRYTGRTHVGSGDI